MTRLGLLAKVRDRQCLLSNTSPMDAEKDLASARAQRFLQYLSTQFESSDDGQQRPKLFDTTALHGIRNVSSNEPGHCYCELNVASCHSNMLGSLHGGLTATIVDTVGSAALATVSESGGVSVHISVDYLAGVQTGGTVAIDAQVLNHGAKLATIEVKLRNKETGRLVASGTHTKYTPAWDVPLNFGTPAKLRSKI